jgi:N-acyl-D-aspartate/D-glutamate deacylase
VRDRQAFTLEQAVRMLTLVPATYWGFADRGLVREGFAADLVVFDPDAIAPLVQRARGIAATVVNGEVLLRDGKHTGALPGRLLRGPAARRG